MISKNGISKDALSHPILCSCCSFVAEVSRLASEKLIALKRSLRKIHVESPHFVFLLQCISLLADIFIEHLNALDEEP